MTRVALALGLLLACAARASADPSAEPDPILDTPGFTADPREYNQALIEVSESIFRRLEEADRQIATLPPIARFEMFRQEGVAAFRDGRARVEAIAERPYDQGFRAAVLESFAAVEHIFDSLLPEVFELATKERVRNADLARLEGVYREVEETGKRCEERVRAAQRAFARAAGVRLREGAERPAPPPAEPSFSAPGIPAVGSSLDGEVYVSFAIRYANEVMDLQNTLASSATRVTDATRGTPADLEQVRTAELEQVRTMRALVEKLEPWQGDESLRAGSIAMARQMESVLSGPLKSFARALGKGIQSQRDADSANALAKEIEAGMQSAFDAFAQGALRFRERWAFDAYEAWEKMQPPEPAPAEPPPADPDRPLRPRPPDDGPPA